MSKLQVHVGKSAGVAAMGERFASAWRRASAGETVDERHLSFGTLEEAATILTPRRLELLREIHRAPAANVRALATALGRNYKNVHGDVQELLTAGAIDRDDAGALHADYDGIAVELAIAL
ncbi:MAG: hypothetical protein WDN69_30785 [Aliidongia sp.]